MTVDKNAVSSSHPAFALVRRLLDETDAHWVHEQAGDDRHLLRKFRAQRRRSFYFCIDAIREEARQARLRWLAAASQLQDYSGVDWPVEMAKLNLRLAWICAVGECQLRFGLNPGSTIRTTAFRQLDRAADFALLVKASN